MDEATRRQTDEWYGVEYLPRGRLRIRIWPGIEAVTDGVPDIHGRVRWYEVKARKLEPLATPVRAWQPLTQAWTWPADEPDPLPPTVLARLEAPDAPHGPPPVTPAATPGTRGRQVRDAEAAALASAMEDDREAAHARRRLPPPDTEPQWWRDATLVRYEPRGAVSLRHGEARLMRALVAERAIRVGIAPIKSSAAALVPLQLLSELWAAPATEAWVAPVHPLPQDWSDYLTVMGWLLEANPSRQALRVLRARSRIPSYNWMQIGDAIDRDWTRARQIYGATVASVVRAANRRPRRAVQRLREIQERNREARR